MFRDTRKKALRNRIIYCAIGILIMAFGVWLNYQSDSSDSADEAADRHEGGAEDISNKRS